MQPAGAHGGPVGAQALIGKQRGDLAAEVPALALGAACQVALPGERGCRQQRPLEACKHGNAARPLPAHCHHHSAGALDHISAPEEAKL